MYVSILLLYVRSYAPRLPRLSVLQWFLALLFFIYLIVLPITLICCVIADR